MNDCILRSTALGVLLGPPVSSAVLAQTHHHDSGHAAPAASASTKQADGVVRKVDFVPAHVDGKLAVTSLEVVR